MAIMDLFFPPKPVPRPAPTDKAVKPGTLAPRPAAK